MELLRQLIGFASQLDFTFEVRWLPTKENGLADAASRFEFTRLFSLAPYLDRQASPVVLSPHPHVLDPSSRPDICSS